LKRFGKRFEKILVRFSKNWKDLERELKRFGKRFEKIWKENWKDLERDLKRFGKRFEKIWKEIWKDLERDFGKRFGKVPQNRQTQLYSLPLV
jgi:translation initiation factor 2 alpha subunit (eIF-2alpha)